MNDYGKNPFHDFSSVKVCDVHMPFRQFVLQSSHLSLNLADFFLDDAGLLFYCTVQ